MGKLKRGRTKYHTPGNNKPNEPTTETSAPVSKTSPKFSIPDNLFAGVDIPQACLETNETLEDNFTRDEDTRSTMSKKSFKSDMPYNKKDKRLLRREAFIMSLNAVKSAEIEEIKRKKRQKTVITGDLQDMLDSLPSLPAFKPKAEIERPTKARSIQKIKKQSLLHNERISKYKNTFLDFCNPKKS